MPEPLQGVQQEEAKSSKLPDVTRSIDENAATPLNAEAVTLEKYQDLLGKYETAERDYRVRDLLKQYIIGFLALAFLVDKTPLYASLVALAAVVIYLQFLATHYKVNYVKDLARQWHDLLYAFSRKKLLGANAIKKEEIEPLPGKENEKPII